MKRTKRLLSTLLALCMVLAMLPATAMAAAPDPEPEAPVERYTVLVLDVGATYYLYHNNYVPIYTVGSPIDTVKAAAKKFVEQIEKAEGNNHVAVVPYGKTAKAVADFNSSLVQVKAAVDALQVSDSRVNITGALEVADNLLKNVADPNAIKNVVLFTHGVASEDPNSPSGKYTYEDCAWINRDNGYYHYALANSAYAKAFSMMSNYNMYSVGLFQNLEDAPDSAKSFVTFAKRVASDLQNSGFYPVADVNKLEFTFGNIADSIVTPEQTDKIVVKIACPVDVTLKSSDGTELATVVNHIVTKGNEYASGDGTTTTLTLTDVDNTAYEVKVVATDSNGTMDYTVLEYGENSPIDEPEPLRVVEYKGVKLIEGQVFSNEVKAKKIAWQTRDYILYRYDNETAYANGTNKKVVSLVDGSFATPDAGGVLGTGSTPAHFAFVPSTVGGTVVLSKRNAEPGDWVNIYVTPDEGYKLESLTVTDMRGWPVTVREMGENAFSFTMPNTRINVNPVFVKVEADNDQYSTNVPTTIPNVEGTSPNYGNMVINTAAMNYSDVNAGDWFYNNVKFCHERYLLNKTGEADGKFEPNTASTRATVWTALSRLAGRNTITQGDNWYDRAQIWAKGKGITDGERPMDPMTREEFVTMLWRYDGNKYVQNNALGQFNDGSSVSWWATEAVKWAVATGLLNGSNGSLNPQNNVTRAEVAAVLQRYVQNVH